MGVAYQGKELQEGNWYPTIDIGMGDDKVKILQPPKNLIDDITWKEAEEFVSRTTMMNVKRLSQIHSEYHRERDGAGAEAYLKQAQTNAVRIMNNSSILSV